MKLQNAIKLCLKIVLLSLLFSGCVSSNVSESEGEKALRVIEKDIDDFRADLRALERVRGEPLDREVFIALDDAKQAVKQGDRNGYRTAIDCYEEALKIMRNHLTDKSVIAEYGEALNNICSRFDNEVALQKYCSRELGKLNELAAKNLLLGIIIPEFSIGPPSTLIDALDYFVHASRDYADPEIPVERRGISMCLALKSNSSLQEGDDVDEADPFGEGLNENEAPVIPKINARFVSLYDAITMVCDATGYELNLRGGTVIIRPAGECE